MECCVSNAGFNEGKTLGSAENKQLTYRFVQGAERTGCTQVKGDALSVQRKQDSFPRNIEIGRTSWRGRFIKRSRKNGTANADTVTSDRQNKDTNRVNTAERDAEETSRKTA
jgi:hypothetical protein